MYHNYCHKTNWLVNVRILLPPTLKLWREDTLHFVSCILHLTTEGRIGGVCWKKSELILNKIPTDCRASRGRTETERSGGQKGRGLGGRNFCPPSLSPLLFSPPQFFVFRFAKCAARTRNGVVFAPPTRAHTTDLLPLFICIIIIQHCLIMQQKI